MADMRTELDRALRREQAPELSPAERAIVDRFEQTPSAFTDDRYSVYFQIATWSHAWTCHTCGDHGDGYDRAEAEVIAQAHADTHVTARQGW